MPGRPSPQPEREEEEEEEHEAGRQPPVCVEEEWDDPEKTLVVTLPSVGPIDATDSGILPDEQEDDLFSEEEVLGDKWDASLYTLQSLAPKPVKVSCLKQLQSRPPQYGNEYHGLLGKCEAEELLGNNCGHYLIRNTAEGNHVLSFVLQKRTYNYRIYYEDELYYVGDKKFENVEDLVEDGLITLFLLEKQNVAAAMAQGRSTTLRRKSTLRQIRLRRQPVVRVKGLKGRAAWKRSISASSATSFSSGSSSSPSSPMSPENSPVLAQHGRGGGGGTGDIPALNLESLSSDPTTTATTAAAAAVSEDGHILTPLSDAMQSNLDRSPPHQRRSTSNIPEQTSSHPAEMESPVVVRQRVTGPAPLGQRRARSANSLQRTGAVRESCIKENRYSAIMSTLRDAVQVDKVSNSKTIDVGGLKAYNSDTGLCATCNNNNGLKTFDAFSHRSHSCSLTVAHSLEKISDLHTSVTMGKAIRPTSSGGTLGNKASVSALVRHLTGPQSPYYKAHKFAAHTYVAPTWCEICHHFLWGLKQQGARCRDCGMDAHKQCLPVAMQLECYPNKKFVKRVYGVDLHTLVKLEGGLIPSIITQCVVELESRGLSSVEGLYRLSGQSSAVLDLKEKFDEGEVIDFSSYSDVNIIAGALKLYLRELPIPLITFDAYKDLMKATTGIIDPDDPATDLSMLASALRLLPSAHCNTLKFLAEHLHRVEQSSEQNKMTARNLAVVFAPTLMRAPSESLTLSLMKELPVQRHFVELLILKHTLLWQ